MSAHLSPWSRPILDHSTISPPTLPAQMPPRAVGRGHVVVQQKDGATRIRDLHQAGALKLLFPRGRPHPEAVMINTAGGITGGDRFDLHAEAGPKTTLTLSTQAAERAYRARAGEIGRMSTRLHVATGACLNWLPQETILFQGCAYHRNMLVDLEEGARFLMAEPVIFGRHAMGETLTMASFRDRVQMRRNGQPIYVDGIDLHGDLVTQLARPAVGGGAGAMATVVLIDEEAEAHLEPLRRLLPRTGGVSLREPGVLILRLLADDGFALRQSLIPILTCLLPAGLPRVWSL